MSYYVKVTATGQAKLADAVANQIPLQITQFAVGDANGAYYEPTGNEAALAHEVWRAPVNRVYRHPNNAAWIVVEAIIPASQGGFDIREAGVFNAAGDMIAIGKYPLTNKPAPGSGSEKDLYARLIMQVTDAASVNQTIDPSLIMATQEYVDRKNVREACRVATTANVALSGLQNIDGVDLAENDRVLVKNQGTGSQNGIYVAKPGVWTRALDADHALEVTDTMIVPVREGTASADTIWMLTTNAPVTIGTTALSFTRIFPDESSRTISDANAPTGDAGTPTTLFGWLAYMIKSITGKANWRTAPATTLEAAKGHIDRTDNPHNTTAAQVSAEPANANIQAHIADSAPHTGHISHSLATAVNDFLVASGVGVFVKKTLAEVKTILGLGDAAYKNTGTAAGTVAAGDHGHTQAQSHNAPDTDSGAAAIHHTLGAGANQAAAGNHGHNNDASIGGPYAGSGHGHANDGNIGGPFIRQADTPIPAGTDMVFYQAAAPTGWTKGTTQNDKALRVVSGNGGGSGGSRALSSVTVGGTAIGANQLPTTAIIQAGGYAHPVSNVGDQPFYEQVNNTSGGQPHDHGLELAYIDVIICTKN